MGDLALPGFVPRPPPRDDTPFMTKHGSDRPFSLSFGKGGLRKGRPHEKFMFHGIEGKSGHNANLLPAHAYQALRRPASFLFAVRARDSCPVPP